MPPAGAVSGPVTDAPTGRADGAAVFARYAFPPNELGYCGPAGAEVLLASGATGAWRGEVERRACLFDGAWPYLRLIADSAAIADPLDARVVRAYWLGGDLLDRVDRDAFVRVVTEQFGTQPGVAERLTGEVVTAAGPHHGFHVLVVYPWIGLLDKGGDVARSVLDQCRIRWGRVTAVGDRHADVAVAAIRHDDGRLYVGGEDVIRTRWAADGHAFVEDLRPGEQVAVHWDWVCDRLGDGEVAQLATRIRAQLEAANAWLAR